jgi:hypothetical protein
LETLCEVAKRLQSGTLNKYFKEKEEEFFAFFNANRRLDASLEKYHAHCKKLVDLGKEYKAVGEWLEEGKTDFEKNKIVKGVAKKISKAANSDLDNETLLMLIKTVYEIYEAMDDEEYLFGKLTNDGGFNHVFFKEQRQPYRKKNHKPIEEKVDVPLSSLVEAKKKSVTVTKNEPILREDKPLEKELAEGELAQEEENKIVKMTLRELFDFYYEAYEKEKWKARWSKIMNHFREYIPDEKRRREFLRENFKRKHHNAKARKLRMDRKMSVNGFNYFVTFTYSDEKMTEAQFIKKLKAYLRNNVNRYG